MLTPAEHALARSVDRLFDPNWHMYGWTELPIGDIYHYNAPVAFFQLRMLTKYNPETGLNDATDDLHTESIVIFIDAACRNAGFTAPRAAYGVYFGPGSCYNTCGRLHNLDPQTRVRAETEALAQAIEVIERYCIPSLHGVRDIKIATDSENLVRIMTCEIDGFILAGGYREDGYQVEDYGMRKIIHEKMVTLRNNGVRCQFWHIDRDDNKKAYKLANVALDQL